MNAPRNPACSLAPLGVLTTREKLWFSMRTLRTFTLKELARHAGVDRHKYRVEDYLRGLVNAGILGRRPAPRFSPVSFTLERDAGVDAPRVRRDGSPVPETAQTRMWRAMKILKTFSALDLVAHASLPDKAIAEGTADDYCHWLTRGGFLRALEGAPKRWLFVKDTGAKAPQILRVKQLYDVNTGKVVAGDDLTDVLDAAEAAS